MIRSQTEKIPPQPVTCGCVGGGEGEGGQRVRGKARVHARSYVTFSASGDFRFNARAARRQSEFPTGSPVAAVETTRSAIGGAII